MNKSINLRNSNSSWVSENPKKAGLIITFVVLFISLLIIDRLMQYIQAIEPYQGPEIVRAIRLREHHPGLNKIIYPDKFYLAETDNLIAQEYPFRVDNNGIILPCNNYDDPDYKIVFIGGSTTECMYVTENNRFPYLTGQIIEEKTKKHINSYNMGGSGNNSIHSLDIILNKIMPMNPDIIVIMHVANDYAVLAYDHTYWPVGTPRSELITINDYFPKRPKETFIWHFKGLFKTIYPNIYQKLFLIKEQILRPKEQQQVKSMDEWEGQRHNIVNRDFDFMQKEFRWAQQMIITACKTHDILPVLMTQANRYKKNPDDFVLKSLSPILKAGISYETFKNEFDSFNNIIRDVAKTNEIPLIDLAKIVPQEKEYMYDTMHYNDTGSKFVANIISDKLIDIISNISK
ncbi:MAG: SGNH/GDSL hydrolase family protein [Candidatus Neomarinimicrobiota bacterium]